MIVYKEQKYLHSELTRTPLMIMEYYDKAYYDRIICSLAMLTSQYYGMPSIAYSTEVKTLKAMELHRRIALGTSEK